MKVLVTGAGGFIGRAAVTALRAAGHKVKAGLRRGAAETPGAVLCDLDEPATLREAVAGVELVVHAAYGDIAAMPMQAEALLAAMTGAGVDNLIALSSIAVYGEADGTVEESTPRRGRLDDYGAAKVACEAAARRWAEAAVGRRAVLLRPGIVYGAGSRFWIEKMAERIRVRAWGEMGAQADGLAALIHVDDLTAMIVGLAARMVESETLPPCLALNAVGPETPSWNIYFAALARALDAPRLARWNADEIGRRQAWALPAKVWRRLGLPGGRGLALAPTRGELALFRRRASYCGKAARGLGLTPIIGLAEGLRRSRLTDSARPRG